MSFFLIKFHPQGEPEASICCVTKGSKYLVFRGLKFEPDPPEFFGGDKRGRFSKALYSPQTGEGYQMDQPEGLHADSLNPPDPVGIPRGLANDTDMSFSTSAHWHWGQLGAGSLVDSSSSSKQWQQPLH